MPVLVDTNLLLRHLTGDPPDQAKRATAFLESADDIVLLDVIAAECIYVLQSFYRTPRAQVAALLRSILAFPAIRSEHPAVMERALTLFGGVAQLAFHDCYLLAAAETSGIHEIVSFDRGIKGSGAVKRIEP